MARETCSAMLMITSSPAARSRVPPPTRWIPYAKLTATTPRARRRRQLDLTGHHGPRIKGKSAQAIVSKSPVGASCTCFLGSDALDGGFLRRDLSLNNGFLCRTLLGRRRLGLSHFLVDIGHLRDLDEAFRLLRNLLLIGLRNAGRFQNLMRQGQSRDHNSACRYGINHKGVLSLMPLP